MAVERLDGVVIGPTATVAEAQTRAVAPRTIRLSVELLDRTAAFYATYLWESDEAAKSREYLLGRGLREETLREFGVPDRLVRAARRHAEQILTFGGGDADVHALHAVRSSEGASKA